MKAPIRAMSVEVTAVAIFAVTTGGFVLVGVSTLIYYYYTILGGVGIA